MQHVEAGIALGGAGLHLSLAHWVNDGLMAVFFFVVGLEIKRELLVGVLAASVCAAVLGHLLLRMSLAPAGAAAGPEPAPATT